MTEQIINRNGIEYKLINLEHNTYRYYISKCAKVWDIDRDIEVPQVLTGKPQYKYVHMTLKDHPKGRVLRRVHNLNLRTYVELPDEDTKYYADHIDRDRFNNHLDNLRWVTRTENLLNTSKSLNKRLTLSGKKYHFPELADEIGKLNNHERSRNLSRLEQLPKNVDYIDFELLELCADEVLKPKPYIYKDKELALISKSVEDYKNLLFVKSKHENIQRKLSESSVIYEDEKFINLEELYSYLKSKFKDEDTVALKTFKMRCREGMSYGEAISVKRIEVKDGKTLRELHEESGVYWDYYVTETRYRSMNRNQATTITWDNIFKIKPRIRHYIYKGNKYKRIDLCKIFNLNKYEVSKKVNFDYPLGQYMIDRGILEGYYVTPIY